MLPISGNKSEMSLAETYFLATRARSKLSKAASRHDHDLRVLVAHANMLDSVMDSLAEKRRLEKSMLNTAAAEREAANAAVAFDDEDDDEEYFSDSDSDTDSDSDEEEEEEEEFDDSKYRNLTHIPFGSNKREFRALPTVDEDTTDLPLLSYSSDEEEEEEELVEVGVVTATTDESQDDLRKPQTPAVVFRTPQIVAIWAFFFFFFGFFPSPASIQHFFLFCFTSSSYCPSPCYIPKLILAKQTCSLISLFFWCLCPCNLFIYLLKFLFYHLFLGFFF